MTALVCFLALSLSAGPPQTTPSKRWLPLLEMTRLFRPAPQTVYVLAPQLPAENAAALRRAVEANGLELEINFAQTGSAPAGAPMPRFDDRTVALVLPEGVDWDASAAALAAGGAYGPTTLLALSGHGQSPGARTALLQAARKFDMAAGDMRGMDPENAGIALREAILALRAPHPVLLALPVFPLFSVALLWLRHRSRHPKNR